MRVVNDIRKNGIKIIQDKEAIRSSTQETRSKILTMLRSGPMTAEQISKALEIDTSTIYRHIKELENHGFIRQVGEEHEKGRPKQIYGRTADMFLMLPRTLNLDKESAEFTQIEFEETEKTLRNLQALGYEIQIDDETIKEFSSLFRELGERFISILRERSEPIDDLHTLNFVRLTVLLLLLEIEENEELRSVISEYIEGLD